MAPPLNRATEGLRRGLLEGLRGIGRALVGLPGVLSFGLVLAWMGLIWFCSSRDIRPPGGGTGALWGLFANFGHAPLFGLLGLFVAAFLLRREGGAERLPRLGGATAALVVGWVALYGWVDEWHQSRTAGRESSVLDIATDVTGAVCVVWIANYLARDDSTERGLRRRLLSGIGVCLIPASLATFL